MKKLSQKKLDWLARLEARLQAQIPVMAIIDAPTKVVDGYPVYDIEAEGATQILIGGTQPPGAPVSLLSRVANRTQEIRSTNLNGGKAPRGAGNAETRKALKATLAEPQFKAALSAFGIKPPVDHRDSNYLALEAAVSEKLRGRKRLRG